MNAQPREWWGDENVTRITRIAMEHAGPGNFERGAEITRQWYNDCELDRGNGWIEPCPAYGAATWFINGLRIGTDLTAELAEQHFQQHGTHSHSHSDIVSF